MSNIAEEKALKAYPINKLYNEQCMMQEDVNIELRTGYEEGYDQAMQDFLEKAERWLEIHMPLGEVSHESVYDYIQGFKNYMQNEM